MFFIHTKKTAVFSFISITSLIIFCSLLFGADSTPTLTGRYKTQQTAIEKTLNEAMQNDSLAVQEESRQKLKDYIDDYTKQIEILQKEIAQLTSALEGVDKPENLNDRATKMLSDFLSLKQEKELQLVELRLLLLNAEEADKKLGKQIDKEMAASLFSRNEPIWSARPVSSNPIDYKLYQHPLVLLLSLLSLLICLFSNSLSRFEGSPDKEQTNLITLLARKFRNHGLLLKVTLFIIFAVPLALFISSHLTVINQLLFPIGSALFFYMAGYWYIPVFFQRLFKIEPNGVTINLFALSSSLLMVVGLGGREVFHVPHYTFSILLLFYQIMFSLMLRSLLVERFNGVWKVLRAFLIMITLTLACLEIIGYTNFIDFLVDATTKTTGTIILASILYDGVELVLAGCVYLKNSLFDKFLYNYSIHDSGFETLTVLGIGVKIYLLLVTAILIAHQWGLSQFSNDDLSNFFFTGIELGGIAIIPARITLGLLIFVLLWPLIGFVKELLDHKWLTHSGFSASSRDSFLTMGGYAGYAILIGLVLSVAGVKLTGLTIVVGALSVGIGFGLQNLVNNFISGIILIFERPIKKGDWILVGSTEGYVKKISIRSTIIQTFDRADVIVPNSELISNQVTNMMLTDNCGRLRVSVGVAYGTDTELVQQLLLQCAAEHPQVMKDGSVPVPRAWFQEFGDSSLNFDLLVHIKEIDMKIQVRSELHTAIDKIFKQHDISIPFPQRDVHLFEQKTE